MSPAIIRCKFDHNDDRLPFSRSSLLRARRSVLEATAINLIQCYFYSQNGMSAPASELPYMVYCGESERTDTSPSLSLETVSGPRASRCPWVLMTHEGFQIFKWDYSP